MHNLKFKQIARNVGFTSCTPKVQGWLVAYGEEIVNETLAEIFDKCPELDDEYITQLVKERWEMK